MKFKLFLVAVVLVAIALPTFAQSQAVLDQVKAILDSGTAKSITISFSGGGGATIEAQFMNMSQFPILAFDDTKTPRKAFVDLGGIRGFTFYPKQAQLNIYF
jgi:hypothetical protein